MTNNKTFAPCCATCRNNHGDSLEDDAHCYLTGVHIGNFDHYCPDYIVFTDESNESFECNEQRSNQLRSGERKIGGD